jgi:ADP-ribosylglycohydrolase
MGSVAVALAVAFLANGTRTNYGVLEEVKEILSGSEVRDKLIYALSLIDDRCPADEALARLGTSGYVPETVGAAFYCLGATDNFKDAVVMAIKAGGDTDTIGAIVGALAGTYYGIEGIPDEYKNQVESFELLQSLTDELLNNENV